MVKFNLTLSDESTQTQCTGGAAYSGTATATDGTGFTISATAQPAATVYSRSGDVISAPLNSGSGSGSIIDSNGNEITVASAGNTVLTDTLGTAALTVSGSGTPASPVLYQYTSAAGSPGTVTVNYASYTVQTNFGCTGINDYPATAQNLVSGIVLPDGTSYSFNYEPTPGFPGSVTGRLQSVTLPTGGAINYAYSGANNGITCADGSAATLTRTSPAGTWIFAHSESGTAWTTTVTDPQNKQTIYNFQQVPGTALAYETERQVSNLETVYTCYNGAGEPCNGTALALPILQRTHWTSIGGLTSEVSTLYNLYGLPTETDEYNYGPSLVRKTLITYASLGNYVSDRPATVTVQNASGGTVRTTSNTYGNTVTGTSGTPQHVAVTGDRGNLLSTTTDGLTESFSYFDTGNVQTITDPAGNQESYTYGDCGNSLMTSANLPLSLSRGESWDCNGGVIASHTGENGKITSYTYDSMNRLTKISYPDGGSKTIGYPSATIRNISTAMTSSTNRQDTLDLDWLGRVTRKVLASDPEGSDFTDVGYDYLGYVNSVSNPYRSTSDPTYGTDTYVHDVLGRVTSITHTDGNSVSFSYGNASPSCGTSGYAVTRTDEVGNQRRTFTDALGRVVEIDQPDPANGNSLTLDTCYTRDVLGNITQVVRGVQTRTYQYDSLSRLTSATTPEAGTTTYSYAGTHGGVCAGDVTAICSRTDPGGVKTTYSYDALSRLTSKKYSDTTPTAYYYYDESSVTANRTAYPLSNTRGRLSHTSTGNGATMTIRSYDAMGRVTSYWQCQIGCSTLRASQYAYDLAGDETSYVHPVGYTITQAFNGAQRIATITSSATGGGNLPTTIASFSYTPFGAPGTIATDAPPSCSGCTPPLQTFDYNSRLQMVREQLGNPGQPGAISCIVNNYYSNQPIPGSCAVPAQGSGNNGQLRSDYDDDVTGSDPNRVLYDSSHTDTYTYDSQGRLTQTAGTPFNSGVYSENLTYSYDAYGNMTCVQNQFTNGTCAQLSFDPATNHITLAGTGVPTYDSKGDLLTDAYTLNTYSYDAEGRLTKIDNSQHVSISYAYNALGQLVEDNRSNWGGMDIEINYDAFGRRFGDYANGTRGYGYWQNEYVPSRKPNVTYANAPDIGEPSQGEFPSPGASADQPTDTPNAEGSWQEQNAPSQEAVGNYKGDASSTSGREYAQYRNQMGSKRWGTYNGSSPAADSLYDPQGNEWYVCTIYGSGVSSYDSFGVYCPCYGPAVHPNGRPYYPQYGRYLAVKSPLRQNLLDPNDLNGYGYKGGDPINNSSKATRNAAEPPSWTPDKPLPDDPKDLGPDWRKNPDYKNPHGEEYINDKTGEKLEWNKGRPGPWGPKADRGRDGWHYTPPGGRRGKQLDPGQMVKRVGEAAWAATIITVIKVIIDTGPDWIPVLVVP